MPRPRQKTLRTNAGAELYRTTLRYDKYSNLTGFDERVNGQAYTTSYTYDNDNRPTAIQYGADTRKVEYTYDELGRIDSKTTRNGTLTRGTSYDYVTGNPALVNATTPLVSSITQYGMDFSYTYDNVGNITSETREGVTTTYAYDSLGQLTRVNDPHENATWVYNYDLGGNITSKVRYAYTTGTLGTALETIPYSYGDSNWKDKLTAYNGQAITYDRNSYYFDRILQLRYAASVGQQTQKRYSYYFTCGNTIEKGPLLTYLDIMYTRQGLDQHGVISRLPETAQTACNTEYLSVIADVDYRIHPRWNLYVKGAYETGKVYKANGPFAKGMYRRSWNAQSSLEFFPIKNSDLFIFLLYTYRGVKLEKAALDMGAVDPDTHRISLGLVYSIPVF